MSQDSADDDFDLDDLDDDNDNSNDEKEVETSQSGEATTKLDEEIEELLNSLDSDRALMKAKESFNLDEFADVL